MAHLRIAQVLTDSLSGLGALENSSSTYRLPFQLGTFNQDNITKKIVSSICSIFSDDCLNASYKTKTRMNDRDQ
jgi:hypothetical protein